MNIYGKPITAEATIYSGAASFPPGSSVPLPPKHAADLIASGHVSEPPANLPKVEKRKAAVETPSAPEDKNNILTG